MDAVVSCGVATPCRRPPPFSVPAHPRGERLGGRVIVPYPFGRLMSCQFEVMARKTIISITDLQELNDDVTTISDADVSKDESRTKKNTLKLRKPGEVFEEGRKRIIQKKKPSSLFINVKSKVSKNVTLLQKPEVGKLKPVSRVQTEDSSDEIIIAPRYKVQKSEYEMFLSRPVQVSLLNKPTVLEAKPQNEMPLKVANPLREEEQNEPAIQNGINLKKTQKARPIKLEEKLNIDLRKPSIPSSESTLVNKETDVKLESKLNPYKPEIEQDIDAENKQKERLMKKFMELAEIDVRGPSVPSSDNMKTLNPKPKLEPSPLLDIEVIIVVEKESESDKLIENVKYETGDLSDIMLVEERKKMNFDLRKPNTLDPKPKLESKSLVDPKLNLESKSLTDPKPDLESKSSVDPKPELESKSLLDPKPKLESESLAGPKPKLESKSLADPKPELESKSLVDPKPEWESKSLVDPKPELESNSLADPKPKLESKSLTALQDVTLQKKPEFNVGVQEIGRGNDQDAVPARSKEQNSMSLNLSSAGTDVLSENEEWKRMEQLCNIGERFLVKLTSYNRAGFNATYGSLVGFIPYRNVSVKYRYYAFESWLRMKGVDPALYKKFDSTGLTGTKNVKQELGLGTETLIENQVAEEPLLSNSNLNFKDLLHEYEQEKDLFLSSFVGKLLRVRVLTVDQKSKRLIFTEKPSESNDILDKRRAVMARLKVGDIVQCQIEKIVYFGIFVQVEGVTALIPDAELLYDGALDIMSSLSVGQLLEARVHELNFTLRRIILSMKGITTDSVKSDVESEVDISSFGGSLEEIQPNEEWKDVELLINEVEKIEEVKSVCKGSLYLSSGLAPTFQVYMAPMVDDKYRLLARSGNKVQEVLVEASMDVEEMKSAILACTSRVA